MKYTIFSYSLESDILLPELHKDNSTSTPTLSFHSAKVDSLPSCSIKWFHHWRFINGQISISAGKEQEYYWLRFPNIADFRMNPLTCHIISYRYSDIPDDTIRHLLLDQVIPRLLSHLGKQIIHASCVRVGQSAIAFCGQSGWGKSTLAAFFHRQGYPILTDDCLLLKKKDSEIIGIPSYQGMRLFQDSLSILPDEQKTTPVAHYGSKRRLIMYSKDNTFTFPVTNIFSLNNPTLIEKLSHISINKIHGSVAAIEIIKHCFPLDVTDTSRMGKQLQNLAQIGDSKNLSIYMLNYPRQRKILPEIISAILNKINPSLQD